jgi:hypothetical protein
MCDRWREVESERCAYRRKGYKSAYAILVEFSKSNPVEEKSS